MRTNSHFMRFIAFLMVVSLACTVCACSQDDIDAISAALDAISTSTLSPASPDAETVIPETAPPTENAAPESATPGTTAASPATNVPETASPAPASTVSAQTDAFNYADVPAFTGEPYVTVNGNTPFFKPNEITAMAAERYSNFDSLGRCSRAWASVGLELMPQTERGDISSVTPSGWNQAKVDGQWLYNRCHLIGYQLTAEDARPQNLITGTRYLNMQGMLPFENMVADYVKETGNHVMYRATPCFVGDELVCRGVLLEGLSVEDGGDGVCFCVFAYNVQPGVVLNYADGSIISSELPVTYDTEGTVTGPEQSAAATAAAPAPDPTPEPDAVPVIAPYIGNKNTGKFHHGSCGSVDDMKESNKVALSTRDEAIAEGYVPCKRCNP